MSRMSRRGAALAAALLCTVAATAAEASREHRAISFAAPVSVTQSAEFQAAEPSIRVDVPDPFHRIWITAPSGIGVDTRNAPVLEDETGGDIFWYSDDDGKTWTHVSNAGAIGPTGLGGGDSDVATGFGDQVYGTGLTLANITLAASCDNGDLFTSNPVSNLGAAEDRQWIDTWEDTAAPPLTAPQFVLNYGNIGARSIVFHQVASPACAPPVAAAPITANHPDCTEALVDSDCYQWPGNLAIDERNGDVYVAHNTLGNDVPPYDDDIVVARVDEGAARTVTQLDVHPFVAANNRPDTFDSFVSVAVDRAGIVYAVWNERHPGATPADGRTDVMLARSKNRGATWSLPVVVNKNVKTAVFPWIVAGDQGRVDVVYYGTANGGPSPEQVPANSQWRVYMAQTLNADRNTFSFDEKAASPVMHQGSICTSGTGCASGTRDLLDYFQVDIDEKGYANIAYTDNFNTPPSGTDPHQEWVTFVQQKSGPGLNR